MSLVVGCLRMELQSQESSLNALFAKRCNLSRGALDRMLIDRMQNDELLSNIRAISMTLLRCLGDAGEHASEDPCVQRIDAVPVGKTGNAYGIEDCRLANSRTSLATTGLIVAPIAVLTPGRLGFPHAAASHGNTTSLLTR